MANHKRQTQSCRHKHLLSPLQRVMPSGFFILLRHFLRVDNVLLKIHDTRFHYEIGNNYIFKEFTMRGASYEELKSVSTSLYFTKRKKHFFYFVVKIK